MKHVCIDARMLQSAGIGSAIKTILPFLSEEKNFKTTLLHFAKDRPYLSAFGFQLIPLSSPIYTIQEQYELPLKIPSCDLFWSPHFNIPLLPIRAKKRLVTLNDFFHLAFWKDLSWKQKCYAKLFYNAAIRLSDTITTISGFSLSEMKTYCNVKKPVEVIHLSPQSHFSYISDNKKKEEVRKRLNLPESFLLCVGNLKPHKNLPLLLKAYIKAKPEEPIVIVGKKDGLLTADTTLFQLVEQTPFLKERVHFLEHVADCDLPAIYSMARLFIFPSLYEGFGLPPLEAMKCRCPVLASCAASIPEICQDGVEYVDAKDLESMSFKMKELLADEKKREQLILKGSKVASYYSPQKTAEKFLKKIYESCNCS